MKIGEILVRRKLLSGQQLRKVLMEQPLTSRKLGELLVEKGIVSEIELKGVLQEQRWRNEGFWVID